MDAKGVVAESHHALAELYLEEGNLSETIGHAIAAQQQFHREQEIDQEADALAVEARALMSERKPSEAAVAAKHSTALLPKIQTALNVSQFWLRSPQFLLPHQVETILVRNWLRRKRKLPAAVIAGCGSRSFWLNASSIRIP